MTEVIVQANRILVPTDFSENSRAALMLAIDLINGRKGKSLTLLHVVEASVPPCDEEEGVLDPETLKTRIEMVAASRDHDVDIESMVVHGDPDTKIVEVANDRNMDLIVMGTHGRTGLAHLVVGSTAEAVLRHASCPVLTIRDPGGTSNGNSQDGESQTLTA